MNLPPWGTFEGWSDLIRNSLVWAGLPDPQETQSELAEQADEETNTLRELMIGWKELGDESTVAEAIVKISVGEAPTLAGLLSSARDQRQTLGNFPTAI